MVRDYCGAVPWIVIPLLPDQVEEEKLISTGVMDPDPERASGRAQRSDLRSGSDSEGMKSPLNIDAKREEQRHKTPDVRQVGNTGMIQGFVVVAAYVTAAAFREYSCSRLL